MKNTTSELQALQKEFFSLHQKIGEYTWKQAVLKYGKVAVPQAERDFINEQLDNYTNSINNILERVYQIVDDSSAEALRSKKEYMQKIKGRNRGSCSNQHE